MTKMVLGRILAARRRAAGLTQADLAARMGTTQAAVSRIESGGVAPTSEVLERYALGIGEPIALVFGAPSEASIDQRRRRVQRVLGEEPFNPWDRDPTPVEQRSLTADGLTRERFAGQGTSR